MFPPPYNNEINTTIENSFSKIIKEIEEKCIKEIEEIKYNNRKNVVINKNIALVILNQMKNNYNLTVNSINSTRNHIKILEKQLIDAKNEMVNWKIQYEKLEANLNIDKEIEKAEQKKSIEMINKNNKEYEKELELIKKDLNENEGFLKDLYSKKKRLDIDFQKAYDELRIAKSNFDKNKGAEDEKNVLNKTISLDIVNRRINIINQKIDYIKNKINEQNNLIINLENKIKTGCGKFQYSSVSLWKNSKEYKDIEENMKKYNNSLTNSINNIKSIENQLENCNNSLNKGIEKEIKEDAEIQEIENAIMLAI